MRHQKNMNKIESKAKFPIEGKMKHMVHQSKSVCSTQVMSNKSLQYSHHYSSNFFGDEKCLSNTAILLPDEITEWPELSPPPSTPEGEYDFEITFRRLPKTFRDVAQLQVPVVRTVGVKHCIKMLGEYFDCTDYEFNFLHFWFLDVITDCIWRSQDQFEFPEEQQRIVLSWVLFFVDVIRDPSHVLTQKNFFALFKESILAAAEVLEEGSGEILMPLKLIKVKNDSERSSLAGLSSTLNLNLHFASSGTSKSSCQPPSEPADSMDYESMLEFHVGSDKHQFVLDHDLCYCNEFDNSSTENDDNLEPELEVEEQNDECNLSDNQTTHEFDYLTFMDSICEDQDNEEVEQNDTDDFTNSNWTYKDFYQPDHRTPSRFLSINTLDELDCMSKSQVEEKVSLRDFGNPSKLTFLQINPQKPASIDNIRDYIIFRKESASEAKASACDEELTHSNKNFAENKNMGNDTIMERLKHFKKMEQRVRDLDDSMVGLSDWQIEDFSSKTSRQKSEITPAESVASKPSIHCFYSEKLENLMKAKELKALDTNELLSYGVLWAIIDFVYEYFSDSFQYAMIRTALTILPNTYQQRMNDRWRTPKGLKEDLTVYVKDLKQKYAKIQKKLGKEPKAKKDKKDKKAKSPKEKKVKGGSDKKSKKSDKKVKVDKKSLKEAKKEEMLLKKRLAEEEAEILRQLMNLKFLSPLQEAIDEDFFSAKFPEWGNVMWKKKGGKEKKAKKEKADKKEKKEKGKAEGKQKKGKEKDKKKAKN